jgi:methionine-rich copper-binding protein CopC
MKRRAALLATLLLAPPWTARAHSELRRSDPPDGAVLAAPPAELRLVFNEAVQVTLFRLLDPTGQPAALRREGDAATARREHAARPAAPPATGAWQVEWRAISADGHPIRGTVAFRVEAPR